nr:hypothetical protein [Tanacetum cinerariifolium]
YEVVEEIESRVEAESNIVKPPLATTPPNRCLWF